MNSNKTFPRKTIDYSPHENMEIVQLKTKDRSYMQNRRQVNYAALLNCEITRMKVSWFECLFFISVHFYYWHPTNYVQTNSQNTMSCVATSRSSFRLTNCIIISLKTAVALHSTQNEKKLNRKYSPKIPLNELIFLSSDSLVYLVLKNS